MNRESKTAKTDRAPFGGLEPPPPPPELRSEVLAAARKTPGSDDSRRLAARRRSARAWHLAWAASTLLLVGLHLRAPTSPRQGSTARPKPPTTLFGQVALAAELEPVEGLWSKRPLPMREQITLELIWRVNNPGWRAELGKEGVL